MSKRSPTAFTLIELLVVISVIALLIALLLPALAASKRASYKAQCGSNLHQIGVAIAAYQADCRGHFPQYWTQAECPTGYTLMSNNQSYLWGAPPGVSRPTLLSKYMGATFASRCALDQGYRPGNSLGWSGTFFEIYGTSYNYQIALVDSINGTVGDLSYPTTNILWKKRIEDIKEPSRLAAAGDITILYVEAFTFPPAAGYLQYMQMHDDRTQELNMLFADSHVKTTVMRPAPEHLVNEDYRVVP